MSVHLVYSDAKKLYMASLGDNGELQNCRPLNVTLTGDRTCGHLIIHKDDLYMLYISPRNYTIDIYRLGSDRVEHVMHLVVTSYGYEQVIQHNEFAYVGKLGPTIKTDHAGRIALECNKTGYRRIIWIQLDHMYVAIEHISDSASMYTRTISPLAYNCDTDTHYLVEYTSCHDRGGVTFGDINKNRVVVVRAIIDQSKLIGINADNFNTLSETEYISWAKTIVITHVKSQNTVVIDINEQAIVLQTIFGSLPCEFAKLNEFIRVYGYKECAGYRIEFRNLIDNSNYHIDVIDAPNIIGIFTRD